MRAGSAFAVALALVATSCGGADIGVSPSAASVTPRPTAAPATPSLATSLPTTDATRALVASPSAASVTGRPTAAPITPSPAASLPTTDATGALRLFSPPFGGEFPSTNLFDHDVPREFTDANGRFVTFWGESIRVNIDGHNGYDWVMPQGTPLVAVAAGTVSFAGPETPFSCPTLGGKTVAGNWVSIDHRVVIGGTPTTIRSQYGHLSSVDVKVGQVVGEGQRIGLAGNTGCSTEAHLHFTTFRSVGSRFVAFDPFGWSGSFADPWAMSPGGVASIPVWKAVPPLYMETSLPPNPRATDNARVAITAIRWLRFPEPADPNAQFVELTLDPRFAPSGSVDLTGYTLRNDRGDAYAFRPGFVIRAGASVRVFAGKGQDTATALYWGRSTIAWAHLGDCARLVSPGGGSYRLSYGSSCP